MNHDARDERISDLLEVPPLDDVTRRRLVRNALRASAPAGSRRRLAAALSAAAVVAALAVGAGLALSSRDADQRVAAPTTAAQPRTSDRRAPPRGTDEAAPGALTPPAASPAGPVDLGDVSDRAVLRERVRAERAAARAKEDTTAAGIPCATQVERALHLTGLHVVGTGTADGEPVLVVTGTNTGDHPVAVSVAPDGCRIREHVTL